MNVRRRRELVEDADYRAAGAHVIDVPPGTAGDPGYVVVAPSLSLTPAWPFGPDGSREDLTVLIGECGSVAKVVCLGPVRERGAALTRARGATAEVLLLEQPASLDGERSRSIGGEPAVGTTLRPGRLVVHDWHVDRAGWGFVAGAQLQPDDDADAALSRFGALLDSWVWTGSP